MHLVIKKFNKGCFPCWDLILSHLVGAGMTAINNSQIGYIESIVWYEVHRSLRYDGAPSLNKLSRSDFSVFLPGSVNSWMFYALISNAVTRREVEKDLKSYSTFRINCSEWSGENI